MPTRNTNKIQRFFTGKLLKTKKKNKKKNQADTMDIMYWMNNRHKNTGEWAQSQNIKMQFDKGVDLSHF